MPSHRAHTFIDRELFGKSYWRLHRNIDMPYLFMGKRHRVLFHDGFSSTMIARELYPDDPQAEEAALIHIQIDSLCSSDPYFKTQLEFFAELDAKKRRKNRKGKPRKNKRKTHKKRQKQTDPMKDLEKFLKKNRGDSKTVKNNYGLTPHCTPPDYTANSPTITPEN